MLTIDADGEGLPQVVVQLHGVAVYLDNWAIIELANGDKKRRKRFVGALKSCGSLLFSFTNAIELAAADGGSAERVREFLDEIGVLDSPRAKSLDSCRTGGGRSNPSIACISLSSRP